MVAQKDGERSTRMTDGASEQLLPEVCQAKEVHSPDKSKKK